MQKRGGQGLARPTSAEEAEKRREVRDQGLEREHDIDNKE